jgi:ketosteroid isomerase-like protein
MSPENVRLTCDLVDLFHARDVEAFVAYCDPSIEFHTEFEAVGGGYETHDGVRRFFRDFEDVWGAGMRLEPEAYFDLGEQTLAFHVVRARGSGSGVEVVTSGAHLVRWRDGLLVYFRGYADRADALSDLGLVADALEPIAPRRR